MSTLKFALLVFAIAVVSSFITQLVTNLMEDDKPKMVETTCQQWTKPDKSDITTVKCWKVAK